MSLVLGQDRPEMPFAEDEHPIGELCPGGEHELSRVSVHPWRPRQCGDDPKTFGLDHLPERGGEDWAAIADQEPQLAEAVT
jgi:hypothetical protein